jgi:5-methylcytosine-specific restriction protein A
MPTRAPRVCGRCGIVHQPGDVCPRAAAAEGERKARADARRPSARQRGYDADWAKLRADFLGAYPCCARCGNKADVVDHIKTIREAPHRRLDITNLQALCTPCHSGWKQSQDKRNAQ